MDYDLADLAPEGLRRFTRAEYDQLIEQGFFGDREPIELIHGLLVKKMGIGDRHKGAADALNELLVLALHAVARVSAGGPIAASDDSEPEPDFTVTEGRELRGKPDAGCVTLVVEVSDTSLQYDRNVKAPLYAAAGIREYWIVNLVDDVVEVYTEPRDGRYQRRIVRCPGEVVAPQAHAGAVFAVEEILGPR